MIKPPLVQNDIYCVDMSFKWSTAKQADKWESYFRIEENGYRKFWDYSDARVLLFSNKYSDRPVDDEVIQSIMSVLNKVGAEFDLVEFKEWLISIKGKKFSVMTYWDMDIWREEFRKEHGYYPGEPKPK